MPCRRRTSICQWTHFGKWVSSRFYLCFAFLLPLFYRVWIYCRVFHVIWFDYHHIHQQHHSCMIEAIPTRQTQDDDGHRQAWQTYRSHSANQQKSNESGGRTLRLIGSDNVYLFWIRDNLRQFPVRADIRYVPGNCLQNCWPLKSNHL